MSRLFVLVLVFAACCSLVWGQTFSTLEKEELKGRVKSIQTMQDTLIRFGEDTVLGEFVYTTYYDTLGRPGAQLTFTVSGQRVEELRHLYSSDGCQKHTTSIRGKTYVNDGRESIRWQTEGVLKVDSLFDDEGLCIFHALFLYDPEGHLVEKNAFRSANDHLHRITYEYDSLGNRIKETRFEIEDDSKQIITYEYDVFGHEIRCELRTIYEGHFEGGFNETREYDAVGNLIKQTIEEDGNDWHSATLENDLQGNWIHSVTIDGEGNRTMRHRKIVYW